MKVHQGDGFPNEQDVPEVDWTNFSAISDENVVKMKTFAFQLHKASNFTDVSMVYLSPTWESDAENVTWDLLGNLIAWCVGVT